MLERRGALWFEELTPPPDPVASCAALRGLPYRLFLDSAARGGERGRYSFLVADPVAVVRAKSTDVERIDVARCAVASIGDGPLDAVRSLLAPHRAEAIDGLPPFQGGAAGFLAYDWGRTLERLPAAQSDDLALPDLVIGLFDWVVAWDHQQSRAWLIVNGLSEDPARRGDLVRKGLTGSGWQGVTVPPMAIQPRGPRPPSYPVPVTDSDAADGLRSTFRRDGYLEAVSRVREYIVAGDIFQANLSQRFEVPLRADPWSLYLRLRTRNAAPFAAFFECPETTILSASPERFLQVDVRGRVETRPIKGTRPRGIGVEHDAALALALTQSDKDRAENLMIVDLMRNDLSRVCLPGTVRVRELFALEKFATVHHLVSSVEGDLQAGKDALDLLRAAFPGGSITGAPKLRAMEIIAELEPSDRSVYCGAIGYWSVTGASDTNIAIRTAVARGDQVFFSAGGGIVADSQPADEYRETLAKARGMIDALAR